MTDLIVIEFLNSGLYTSIQDAGRSGWQEFGVPVSGAMDISALSTANRIVGNQHFGPCFEITLVGPRIRIHGQGTIALTGADISARLNRQPLPSYETVQVKDGDEISFGKCRYGCRAYVAVAGEWEVESWLGSSSEVPYAAGFRGLPKPVRPGFEVLINCRRRVRYKRENPPPEPGYKKPIRILPGPEINQFSKESIYDLVNREQLISQHSNRMGYRLLGMLNGYEPLPEMISSAIVPGVIQVTRSGQLIILMVDAQTTGGYPRIANVYHMDLAVLAQMKPGDRFKFEWIA